MAKKEVDAAHKTITKLTKRHKWKSTTTTKETLKEDGHKTSQQVASRHENDDGGRPRYGHPIAQSIFELTKFSLWKNCYYIHSVGGFLFFFWETDTFTCCCSFSVTHTHTHTCCSWNEQLNASGGRAIVVFICERNWHVYIFPWLYYSRFIVEKEEKWEREENTKEMCNTRSCKSRPRLCQGSRHFQRFGRREGERSWPVGNPTTVKNITKEKRDFSLLVFERKIKLDGKNLYPLKKILQFACPHFFWRLAY